MSNRAGKDGQHTFVTVGSAQPEDVSDVKAKERNKFLPVHMQEPRDEQGRKRFHGAFTGGFSAGYFNSVGSKEGWAPSQFVSSRSSRFNAHNAAKPEDFMDDEDLDDINGGKKIAATEEFDLLGGTAKELARKRAAISTATGEGGEVLAGVSGKLVEDLIGPAKDPIGVKLLRQMGWREGHGVGPRAKRKRHEKEDVYALNHTFAPRDTAVDLLRPKTDSFGLGFDPFRHAPEFAGRQLHANGPDKSTAAAPIKAAGGFGVGVFEDEDEDLDVYGSGMANYDMVIDDDDDHVFRRKFGNQPARKDTQAKRGSQREPTGTFTVSVQICHDGRPPLDGFVLATNAMLEPKWYRPPELPAGFEPMHKFTTGSTGSQIDLSQQGVHSQPAADRRRELLGEEALKAPARSVFSFLPIKEQDRLQDFIDKATKSRAAHAQDAAPPLPKEDGPPVAKDTAMAALKGFMPFGNDMPKQQRYRRFLEVKAGLAEHYAPVPKELTGQSIAHETLEFSKAAQIFKPLSSLMASRFTSASQSTELSHVPAKLLDIQNGAADMNMYGSLTRSRAEWRPERLLCKRFNIADPYAAGRKKEKKQDEEGDAEREKGMKEREREAVNPRAMSDLFVERDRLMAEGHLKAEPKKVSALGDSPEDSKEMLGGDIAEMSGIPAQIEDDSEPPEMVPERPAMDIFKAIFADSEEDSDSEVEPDAVVTIPSALAPDAFVAPVHALPPPQPVERPEERLPPPTFRPVFRRKQDRGKQAILTPASTTAAPTTATPTSEAPAAVEETIITGTTIAAPKVIPDAPSQPTPPILTSAPFIAQKRALPIDQSPPFDAVPKDSHKKHKKSSSSKEKRKRSSDHGDEEGPKAQSKHRKDKRRKRDLPPKSLRPVDYGDEEEEDVWVEKPAPRAVVAVKIATKPLPATSVKAPFDAHGGGGKGTQTALAKPAFLRDEEDESDDEAPKIRARPSASDFM
ncbi:hypothetical protein HKX48_005066 [Thoreauomyces humboldtii]|nr:hypothetical protein HKX48_005066 [Thoreauomyces humboldtii]